MDIYKTVLNKSTLKDWDLRNGDLAFKVLHPQWFGCFLVYDTLENYRCHGS